MYQRPDWRGSCRAIAIVATIVLSFVFTMPAAAQDGRTPGASQETAGVPLKAPSHTPTSSANVFVPETSVHRDEDAGVRAHTNYVFRTSNGARPGAVNPNLTEAETPASLGCVYKVGPAYTGCNPSTGGSRHPSGGWGTIALVDAFDNPDAASDLATFDTTFGIPAPPSFTKVYATANDPTNCPGGGAPAPNAGWAIEESLDIEWAHAMAPSAKIVLVESCTNSNADLYYAELVAGSIVEGAGGGDISNSWGEGEYSSEAADDPNFFTHWVNTVYFASAGDSGCGAAYPSSSPWVVSAGGTTVNRNSSGNFSNESCWAGSGGGSSSVEKWGPTTAFRGDGMGPWSTYQYPQFGGYLSGATRQTPDFAFDADPASGVYVDSLYYGQVHGFCTVDPCFFIVGGTSVSSPSLAGIVNNANNRLGQGVGGGFYTTQENNMLYDQLFSHTAYGKNFYDVKTGTNGCSVGAGWDYCTGVGSPRGLLGK